MIESYPFKLALITNRHLVKNVPLIKLVEGALKGGVDAVILREPDLSPKALVVVSREFRKVTRDYNAKLIVKDRIDVALISEADGVQLGADSITPSYARKIWSGLIGYSAHSEREIRELENHVDYFILSPLFYTRSKPFSKPIGLEKFVEIASKAKKPIYPLGGIDLDKVVKLKEAGINVAVIMSAFYRDDPFVMASKIRSVFEEVS
ncbi:MAG: thiamine phosphate synthase [Thermosulfidibacteraceae bacterium]|jgi:thiamine-phosphate pyrophosphorylase